MKIVFTSLSNASDVQSWSGLTFHISQALAAQPGVEIVYIDGLGDKHKGLSYLVQGVKKVIYGKLGKHIDIKLSRWRLKEISKSLQKQLPEDADVIFSDSSLPIAYLETNIPKVFYTDATFTSILGFYRPVSAMAGETVRNGKMIDQLALERCQLAIYSSDWAANSAVKDYGTPAKKVKVVPFGANIESARTVDDIRNLARQRVGSDVCNFLFLGVNWERKGGDVAVEVVRKMNENGIRSVLHVAGISETRELGEYVVNHGFISKRDSEGRKKLDDLMRTSHFLILPTRADCTPVVYSEANSFGLPVLTTDVGGINTIVQNDVNGKTFSLDEKAEKYAVYAKEVFTDNERYISLSESSFQQYQSRLNWEVAGKTILELLKNIK